MPLRLPHGHLPVLPPGFVLGAGTSAYQVEGSVAVDGRGASVWDTFTHAGLGERGETGDVAADHYRRVEEDLDLLTDLGVGGYRFSIAWPRIQPDGRGAINPAGLDFYDRLVDGLLERGIEPMATLYHWDLPQGLQDDGGWLNRATIEHFEAYAHVVGERLADRVAHWIPVNSPSLESLQGYGLGTHAPGHGLFFGGLVSAHHLLIAHGRGAVALREEGARSIGTANNHAPIWPASDDAADVGASKLFDAVWNGFFLESMLLGRYPVDLLPLVEEIVEPGDLVTIRQPLDFYGVSYYRPIKVAATTAEDADLPFELVETLGYPQTTMGWPVVPDALREWLVMFRARLRAALPPIVITECGGAFGEGTDDQARIDFLAGHLNAVAEAVQRGVDVRGFYVWSFLDTYAWTAGYEQRYGLVEVDRTTLERRPRDSFSWYRAVSEAQPTGSG